MKPIIHLPLIKGYKGYRYFIVKTKDYQLFTQLKTALTVEAAQNNAVDNKLILECFSLLHDITLEESVYYITEIRDFISEASYFMNKNEYSFEPHYYIEPGTKHKYPDYSGSDDMLFYIIQVTSRKQRRGKIKSASTCIMSLVKAMKEWLIDNEKTTAYTRGGVISIAGYITIHFFGYLKGSKLKKKDMPQDYFQAAKGTLKNIGGFDKKYFLDFTSQD